MSPTLHTIQEKYHQEQVLTLVLTTKVKNKELSYRKRTSTPNTKKQPKMIVK